MRVRWGTPPVVVLGLAAIYLLAGKLGLLLAFVHASATAVWPPTGIALAAFLLLGYRVWPGIFLGAFLVNLTTAGSVATTLGIATGNTLEGLAGAYLLNRFAHGVHACDRPQDVFKFAALAALASTTVSPFFGVTSLALGGYADWAEYGRIWLTWWLGDAGGALIVAPVLLLWGQDPRAHWTLAQVKEVGLLLVTLLLVGLAVFGGVLPITIETYPLGFLCIPILLWTAFRFGPRETATATLLLSGIAIWGTLSGFGPFARETQNESLLLLQSFMGVAGIMALALAAGVVEQRRAEAALAREAADTRAILDMALDAVIGMDEHGVITNWNPRAEVIFGWAAGEAVGKKLSEVVIPPQYREAHIRGLAHFLATGQGPVLNRRIEITGLRRDGREIPVELTITPLRLADAWVFSAFVRDISERRQVEQRRAGQYAVTRILAEAKTLAEAGAGILRAICESLDWQAGVLWILDRERDVLRCLEIWHPANVDLAEFERVTREMTFVRGVGLPGDVWAGDGPIWHRDVTRLAGPRFPRLAHATAACLRGAFGFPIRSATAVTGVIEFFSREPREPDPDLLEMTAALG